MMLLGELGGLYGALVGIPSYFISSFVQISFMSAVAQLAPVKKEENPDTPESITEVGAPTQLRDQLAEFEASKDMPPTLTQDDA